MGVVERPPALHPIVPDQQGLEVQWSALSTPQTQ
jgi:hypothetical protein